MYALTSSPSGGVVHLTHPSGGVAYYASSNTGDKYNATWTTAPAAGHVLEIIGQTRSNPCIEADVTGMLLTDDVIATLRITSETNNHSCTVKYSSKGYEEGHPVPELRVCF